MSIFHELFKNSDRKPTLYRGKTIYLIDYIELNKGDTLFVKLLSTKTQHKVRFSINIIEPSRKKYLQANGEKWHGFLFWGDTFPKEGTDIKILEDKVKIGISSGFASIWSWPMIIEKKENKKTYHCFTGDNEDFNGFVFEVDIKRAY